MSRPLYIFDLDGTIALTHHRSHILQDLQDPDRWRRFFAACIQDRPNWPVIRTMNALLDTGADVWIWSARSDEVRDETYAWLITHTRFFSWTLDRILCMRQATDFTPDEELKKQWLDNMLVDDRERLVAVFDDRKKVVDMWRANGVTCFQVAPGEF